MFVNLSDNPKL